MYDLTPIRTDGMNIRADHNTTSEIKGSLYFGVHAVGEEIYEVKENGEAKDAKFGDCWMRIISPQVGWVAIIHDGISLSIVTSGETIPTGNFPDRFLLTDPKTGASADYERIVK